ncbi:MAG: dockerin type I domain-containing protein, partial [Gemmatimonadota bacterium]|nr:dockerin type I domain-containing protein [Gemmatimonadota bacterium]
LVLSEARILDDIQQPVEVTLVNGAISIPGCALLGDVNGDGTVNLFDVLSIVRYNLGILIPTSYQKECADINGDGVMDILDVVACVDMALGKDTQLAAYSMSGDPAQIDTRRLREDLLALGAEESQIEEVFRLVSREPAALLPEAFSLGRNTPNPFNPATTIEYCVPGGEQAAPVTLKVYDMRGSLVRTLVDKITRGGNYTVFWDGTGQSGRRLSSGVYLYRMKAGSFVQTRKMVLLK